jgi:hypothetical protein
MDPVDCQVFEDQLDSLVRGELSAEGTEHLRAHAAGCAACDALWRVQAHLATPSLETLESQVPEAWVTSMWSEVQTAVRSGGAGGRVRGRWGIPTLAAAAVALLLANGLTLRALHDARAREQVLTERLLDREPGSEAPETPTAVRSGRGAALPGRDGWLRTLEARDDLTVADLRALLSELPSGTRLISASRADELAGARLVPAAWREAFARIDTQAGVTVADLVDLLDDLNLPGGASVPTARLIELLS